MTVTKCDVCGTEMTTAKDVVRVGVRSDGFLASECCADCGKPVVQFLKRVEKTLTSKKPQPMSS
jgi:hypothetical protein